MPLVRLTVSENIDSETRKSIMSELSKRLSDITGKPEKYMMILFQCDSLIMFDGTTEGSMFIEIKSIGALDSQKTTRITKEFCTYLSRETGISEERIYMEFRDVAASMWGWNGKTFA